MSCNPRLDVTARLHQQKGPHEVCHKTEVDRLSKEKTRIAAAAGVVREKFTASGTQVEAKVETLSEEKVVPLFVAVRLSIAPAPALIDSVLPGAWQRLLMLEKGKVKESTKTVEMQALQKFKGQVKRARNGCRRSLLRRTRARGERARASEERRGRSSGGEVRSGENAIVKARRCEGPLRVRAPERGNRRRRDKTRGNRSVQDAISINCW